MVILTETVSEDLTKSAIEIMLQSPVGTAIICVIGLAAILVPILLPVAKEWRESLKEKREALQAEEERKQQEAVERAKKEQREEEFHKKLEDVVESIPKINEQVTSLSVEVNSLRELRENWNSLSTTLETSINNLSREVSTIAEQSSEDDKIIQENLQETQKMVQSLSETTDTIKSKVNTIIEGDLNSFRVYISQLYNKYIVSKKPFPRSVKQELRVKFETYEKEGGNSWARGMYNELISLPVVHDEYLREDTKNEDESK